jgi:hypothetical protein
MGKVFLIARVRTSSSSDAKQRKCIGAFYHQWLYGSWAFKLEACSRFFDLLSNPLHTHAVREEIDMVRWDEQPSVEYEYYDGSNYDHGSKENVFLPCPFTSYLFYTAALTGHQFTLNRTILDARKRSHDGVPISLLIAF